MGWFSSAISSIGSFISSACSVISDCVSKLGSEITEIATGITKLGVNLAAKVGEVIKNVGVLLGIIYSEDSMAELGEKAMLSEKVPEDFDSIKAYIDHLKHDVYLDKEKFDNLSEPEILARSSIGASITLKGINEKLDTVVSPSFMAMVAEQNLKGEEIVNTIKAYKEKNLNTADYSLYIKDELSIDDSHKHSNALVEAYQTLEPDLTIEQIEDKVMGLKS